MNVEAKFSYVNKAGERIYVGEQHLSISLKIKEELIKMSPSGRMNWKKHKELMEANGLLDSEASESYRQMLRNYETKLKKSQDLDYIHPEIEAAQVEEEYHENPVREVIGDLAYYRRLNQNITRELNKLRRELIDKDIMYEKINQAFRSIDLKPFNRSSIEIRKEESHLEKSELIAFLSCWHIGALVDLDNNQFSFQVAEKRVKAFLDEIIKTARFENAKKIHIVNLGDIIEHPYMHNLAYTSEFSFVEQMAKAASLIIQMLDVLSSEFQVTFAGIGGNHDRIHSDKKKGLQGDHAGKVINEIVKTFILAINNTNIEYVQAKDYEHSMSINGLNIKCVHGDLDNKNDKNIISKHSTKDRVIYDLLVMAHYHHHFVTEIGFNSYVIGFASLKGADDYADNHRYFSAASQGMIIVDDKGNHSVKNVQLQKKF